MEICPICKYELDKCQCRFAGSAHPNRDKIRDAVVNHLYLLSSAQLAHIIDLERWWAMSYSDDERTEILNHLMEESK